MKSGDVVRRKSDGMIMNVGKIEGDRAECAWLDVARRIHVAWYSFDEIDKA